MSRPKCPNHTVEMQFSGTPRIYICPVSSARFECDVEDQKKDIKFDKFGNHMTTFTITPLDGNEG